ncbi:MAG: protein phosphatase CheZ [Methylophilaceae bacterium]|nr:protein phosphatase CheZ [Methylophilaceae bacterium]
MPDARLEKIGRATAKLHRLLKALGHTRSLEQSAATMPDARDRLAYIDQCMHEASEKTISAVEASLALIDRNRAACAELSMRLSDTVFHEHRALVEEVISVLGEIASGEETVHHNLMQIMEAQEFRDVAGQMVNKIIDAAQEIEHILLDLLKEYVPDTKDSLISREGFTAGPSLKRDAGLQGQDEVDDLLASLGL